MPNVFADLRVACAQVADAAGLVHIDSEGLQRLVESIIPLPPVTTMIMDPDYAILEPAADAIAFAITMDAINFGSGWFPALRKPHGFSGYFTIAQGLARWFRERGTPTAEQLECTDPETCAGLFGQSMDEPGPAELMKLYAQALNHLGALLNRSYAGSYTSLLEAASHSAARLVGLLDAMPFYHDVSQYGDISIPFYKRAQITASDIALVVPAHPLGRFDDLSDLTIFADNLVPHVLRVEGVLWLDQDLGRGIDDGVMLDRGSPGEVELRACAVHATELMVRELRDRGEACTARQVDMVLWNRGQQARFKSIPRPRCRTTAY